MKSIEIFGLVAQPWHIVLCLVGVFLLGLLIKAEVDQKRAQQMPDSGNYYRRCDNCGGRAHAGRKCGTP